ncbi:MAG TPA: hypothetical protein VFQ53_00085 [Kofleriaceae bacterium]|nr:hypothetical protein [Kofleriaceae bacterium]
MQARLLAALGLVAACERASPPPDHAIVVATVDAVRLDGSALFALDAGRVPDAERAHYTPPHQGELEIASKLRTALAPRCPATKPVELQLDGALSAETFFVLLLSVGAAGCNDLTLAVRDQPWHIPHRMFSGRAPEHHVELRATTTDAELAALAAPLASTPPADGALVILHPTVTVRQILQFAHATPPAMRRVYAFDRD